MSASGDRDGLDFRATAHETHVDDGDRSWRYGDGFLVNLVGHAHRGRPAPTRGVMEA